MIYIFNSEMFFVVSLYLSQKDLAMLFLCRVSPQLKTSNGASPMGGFFTKLQATGSTLTTQSLTCRSWKKKESQGRIQDLLFVLLQICMENLGRFKNWIFTKGNINKLLIEHVSSYAIIMCHKIDSLVSLLPYFLTKYH